MMQKGATSPAGAPFYRRCPTMIKKCLEPSRSHFLLPPSQSQKRKTERMLGDVVYTTKGSNGCVIYVICSSKCTIETYQGQCSTTTAPKTSTRLPSPSPTPTSTSTLKTSISPTKQSGITKTPPIIHIINCSNSVCEMNGNRSIMTIYCPPVLYPVCASGAPPAKIYDKDLCCFQYECQYCTGPDGLPKQSGETWQSGCNECFCSKTFLVQCSPVVCGLPTVAACYKEGFELITVPAPSNTCCPSEECRCNPNLCPRPLNNCDPGFEFTATFEDGNCCASFSCVPKNVCVVNGLEYQPLSPIPTDKGSCISCNCTTEKDPGTQLNMVRCIAISCITDCEPGYMVIRKDGDCCGSCIQVACVMKNANGTQEVHQPGDIWRTPDLNCISYRCENVGTTFTVVVEKTICSPFVPNICEPGTIEMTPDGCCQTCQVNVTKQCSLLTMQVRVTYNSCSSLVELGYCSGPCMSSSMYVLTTQTMARKCSCCKEVLMDTKMVELNCPNGSFINYSVSSVAECDCVTTSC